MIEPASFAITREAPPSFAALRRGVYAGEVYLLEPTPGSLALVERVRARLADVLGDDPRRAQHRMSNDELFARLSPLRRELYCDATYHDALRALLREQGGDPAALAFDPLRLRVVRSRGDVEVPAARAVYYPHRDTWYAHPQSLVAWWIPLDDLGEDETFAFFPERFEREVPNDSEAFDYDEWVRDGWELKIGWQRRDAGLTARYPGVLGEIAAGRAVGFSCQRGQHLAFSGAHFHATLPQATGRTRFSLDFRLVHLGDEAAGEGAPNVDGRSRGSALRDYVRTP
ncbi:MAG: hypothetical protein KF729_25000 [Sandaracinaceae bacterium]|nr:hypothetical protein [Sandaracinaceae bacterium]